MTIKLNKKTLGYLVAFLALVALVLWGCLDAFGFKVVSESFLGKTESITNYTGFKVFFGITEKTEIFQAPLQLFLKGCREDRHRWSHPNECRYVPQVP